MEEESWLRDFPTPTGFVARGTKATEGAKGASFTTIKMEIEQKQKEQLK